MAAYRLSSGVTLLIGAMPLLHPSGETLNMLAYQHLVQGGVAHQREAIRLSELALQNEPASPSRWSDLGEAEADEGLVERARLCMRNAMTLGPNTPEIWMRAATFYFSTHDISRAVSATARILDLTPDYDELVFGLHDGLGIDPDQVRRHLSDNRRAGIAMLRHELATTPQTAGSTWAWLKNRGWVSDQLAAECVGHLLRRQDRRAAFAIWADWVGKRCPDFPDPNRVFNGSFEYESTGAAFDWNSQPTPGVEVTRDAHSGRTGAYALRVDFSGTDNIDFTNVSQLIDVPAGRYAFSGYLRAEGLTTDQGVRFRISDADRPERFNVMTDQVLGTTDWKLLKAMIVVPHGSSLLSVQVYRAASMKFDSKIAGSVWVDDVKVSRVGQ